MSRKTFILVFLAFISMTIKAQVSPDSVGIYAVNGNELTRMELLKFQTIKGSGGLAAAATFGVAKIKAKYEYKGATSNYPFQGKATFRLFFGNPPVEQIAKFYMFTPSYSIKDFSVAKFDVKKNKRLLTGASASLLGSTVGVVEAEGITIETKEIRSGAYELYVTGEPGEYCLMFIGQGMGAGAGVFDFTIK